ncbi:DUF58 domain-containing protein [Pseudoalteromonas denitrificans]|uniref:Uncharacterized protein n=1 Tax=Pseudoalteromonas denitrificans DSM 6059 TaxID=1123010 RepID=A0A1I1FZW2_9GAMM|nr:DUF58 domain-containing protein [Pseudoalteromonas denitrificans]SFC04825.1 Protein of unknown function DUF58 [Pseudoalteromonas denitrificans DSM 6059]
MIKLTLDSVKNLKHKLNAFLNKLLLKRKHQSIDLTLKHHNIYVLPSKFGLIFLCFTFLIFLLGSNYQNNLILLTAYLLISIFTIGILQSYFNLINTQISFIGVEDGIEKTGYLLTFSVMNQNKTYSFVAESGNNITLVDTISSDKKLVELQIEGLKRGKHSIDRIKMVSRYPYGLMTVWSYAIFPKHVYIYPTPLPILSHNMTFFGEGEEQLKDFKHGNDEFFAMREHEIGESLSRVSWKHYAKTGELLVKEFSEYNSGDYIFNLEDIPGDFETKLSHLSYLVNQAFHDELHYGLVLPNKSIPASQGLSHLKNCLRALSEA